DVIDEGAHHELLRAHGGHPREHGAAARELLVGEAAHGRGRNHRSVLVEGHRLRLGAAGEIHGMLGVHLVEHLRGEVRQRLAAGDRRDDVGDRLVGTRERLAWRVAQWPAIARHAEHIAVLTEEMTASDELLRGYLQMTVSTIYHPVGTARMGPDGDAGAVVDQRGRVPASMGWRWWMRRSCRTSREPTPI